MQRDSSDPVQHMQHLTDEQLQRLTTFRHAFTFIDTDERKAKNTPAQGRYIKANNRSKKERRSWSRPTENRAINTLRYTTQSNDYPDRPVKRRRPNG